MEYGVIAGGILTMLGILLLAKATWVWENSGFGRLSSEISVRQVIPAVIMIGVGVQTVFGSFFLSMLSYVRRK